MSIWPLPKSASAGSTVVRLADSIQHIYTRTVIPLEVFKAFWEKCSTSKQNSSTLALHGNLSSADILDAAVKRTISSLFAEKFVPYKFHSRDAKFEPLQCDLDASKCVQDIIFQEQTSDVESPEFAVSSDAYSLEITTDGQVIIKFIAVDGALRALATFSQLFYAHSESGACLYTPYTPVSVMDSPLFEHRGLNLDISRNRISPKDVMRTLEAMGFNKLNRLHLHASDAQSWPLDIPALPELASKGCYHKSQIWSVADLEAVQEFGAYRGVAVYLEIDMPGHTASINHAYPHLITAYNQNPWPEFAKEPPSGQLKLNCPEVYDFLGTLMHDLLPRVSKYSHLFHLGCDEVNLNAYTMDENISSNSRDVIRPHLQKLFDHVFSLLSAKGMAPVAWEEIVTEWQLELPKSAVIQIWRNNDSLAKVTAKGYRALFGAASHWYLDGGHGGWVERDPSNLNSAVQSPFLDWCSPYKNWRQVYSYDPLVKIPEGQKHLVIGGEVHLWCELTDSTTLDGMLWPRVAAAGEILWRGKGELGESVTRRLAMMRERMICRGVQAGMVQMEWCLKNPGGSFI